MTVGIFILVGILFWMALSMRLIQPLQKLAAYSRTIGRDLQVSPDQRKSLVELSNRTDQLGYLSRSLQRMELEIEARLNELSTLLQTSAEVLSSLDSKIVLNRILEQVERLMDIEMCTIVAYDENSGVFRAQASRGLSKRYTQQLEINPSEPQSISLRAIRTGEPIQISDTEQDPSFKAFRPRARSEGYRSILAAPLITQHAPPSALLVYRPDAHFFNKREITLLTNFANHAAMAIENATLYARSDMRLQEQTRRLEALIQSLQDGLLLEDLHGKILYANRRICELVGLSLEEISGAQIAQLIERLLSQSVDSQQARKGVENALEGQGPRQVEITVKASSGIRYLRLSAFDVTDSRGMPIGRGQILRDVTRNREIDRMKSSLVSTVSHELRTPLAAIKGYATTLLAEDVEWDEITQREFLEIISNETDRLSNLVSDLLDISRIEAGNLIVSRQECDLEELIIRAAHRAHPNPDGCLQLELSDGLPPIFADPQRIESVIRNLIENAAKYAGVTSPVHIKAEVQNGAIIVRVEDQGPGIPAEESERIFDSFYRLESGLTRSTPGAGLGLAICQGFVHAHGGDIWLEPRPSGACIAFSLPLKHELKGEINL
jgi:PAS domain S-box-containing protein